MLTPDDLLSGTHRLTQTGVESQRVVVFDDDHYYLGGVLAELLASRGHEVRLVTPAPLASSWTFHTLELGAIQRRLRGAGITVDANRTLVGVSTGEARLACVFTGEESVCAAEVVVLVTARLPVDGVFSALSQRRDEWDDHGVRSVRCIGDAWAPSTIAAAVWSGRRYAEEFDVPENEPDAPMYRREYTALAEPG